MNPHHSSGMPVQAKPNQTNPSQAKPEPRPPHTFAPHIYCPSRLFGVSAERPYFSTAVAPFLSIHPAPSLHPSIHPSTPATGTHTPTHDGQQFQTGSSIDLIHVFQNHTLFSRLRPSVHAAAAAAANPTPSTSERAFTSRHSQSFPFLRQPVMPPLPPPLQPPLSPPYRTLRQGLPRGRTSPQTAQ